ncbi:hypothetical protein ACXWTF_12860 [Thiomicrolovo sp. ZZH C-3]
MPRVITNLFGERVVDFSHLRSPAQEEKEEAIRLHAKQQTFDDIRKPKLFYISF